MAHRKWASANYIYDGCHGECEFSVPPFWFFKRKYKSGGVFLVKYSENILKRDKACMASVAIVYNWEGYVLAEGP